MGTEDHLVARYALLLAHLSLPAQDDIANETDQTVAGFVDTLHC